MSDVLSVQQKALLAIKRLQERVAELEQREHEPIAVLGIGCRFPNGVTDYTDFARVLCEGRDLVDELPDERYEPLGNERREGQRVHGAFVHGVESFDAAFFRISREECATLDPQQRLLLETTWEAVEDAGISPTSLRETLTGTFFGVSNSDYRILLNDYGVSSRYRTTGASFAAASGRASYFLGLQGPNMSLDTACSSSLVAIYLACQSLRARHCDLALSGGANLMVAAPITSRWTEQASMLSPTGKCHTFDGAADGYVRGEGVAVVLLKRLGDALRDRDPIHAVIRGVATNHNGASSGLTVPGPDAQVKLLRAALADARVRASDVQYVEAHGTGTALGDPIEMRALSEVYGDRAPGRPLLVGSVKTNIGHLENAAGIAGLLKVIVAMKEEVIPPHLHLTRPNPHIPWEAIPIAVASTSVPWISGGKPRLAAVSSFGFAGSNAHAILEEAPRVDVAAANRQLSVLLLSAATPDALGAQVSQFIHYLGAEDRPAFADICFTASVGRAHLKHRCGVTAETCEEAIDALHAWALQSRARPAAEQDKGGAARSKIAFLFGDTDPEDTRAIAQRAASEPMLLASLERAKAGLAQDEADPGRLLSYTLVELWRSWGLVPECVVGLGRGRDAAARVARALGAKSVQLSVADGSVLTALRESGVTDCIDLTSDRGLGSAAAEDAGPRIHVSIRRDGGTRRALLSVVAALYQSGITLDFAAMADEGRRKVRLPLYPFSRQRYWFDELLDEPFPTATPERSTAPSPPLGDIFYEVLWQRKDLPPLPT